MEIRIESQIGICEEFMVDKNSPTASVTIVISPLKVMAKVEGDIKVTSGCNMWQACYNRRCHFSSEARRQPKIRELTY